MKKNQAGRTYLTLYLTGMKGIDVLPKDHKAKNREYSNWLGKGLCGECRSPRGDLGGWIRSYSLDKYRHPGEAKSGTLVTEITQTNELFLCF